MLSHLFKLIWNKRKQNILLISEMLLSFLVIFGIITFGINACRNYATPMGFDYRPVWVINYANPVKTTNSDSLTLVYETLKRNLKALSGVEEASYTSDNLPFSRNTNSTGINYNHQHVNNVNQISVDADYLKALKGTMYEGSWYSGNSNPSKDRVTIINKALKEKLFGKSAALGKFIEDYDGKHRIKIVGVVNDIKFRGDYQALEMAMYNRYDTSAYHWLGNILVKVKPGADAAFESRLYKTASRSLGNADIEIDHLSNTLVSADKFTLVPLIILSIIAGFLIINVALGLFGVLWYTINKRRGEIGLRRALGATGRSVSAQLVAEAMILATFSMGVGSFFAIQFPLLHVFDLSTGVYLMALVSAIGFIYLLVLLCALYPGRQAAAILPAISLREE